MINLIDFWKWAEVSSDEYAVNGMRGNKEEFEFDGWRFLIDTAFDMITKMQNQTVEENELETFLLSWLWIMSGRMFLICLKISL